MKPIDMLQELQTWHSFSNAEMENALASPSTPEFKSFVEDFKSGRYDEDIDMAKSHFLMTLKK